MDATHLLARLGACSGMALILCLSACQLGANCPDIEYTPRELLDDDEDEEALALLEDEAFNQDEQDEEAAETALPTLLLDGTDEIPPALSARLQQYVNTRRAQLMDISADGETVLIRTRFGETEQLHLVSSPLGHRQQITFGEEPVRAAGFVPGGEGDLVYMSDVGGAEDYQLFRRDTATGRSELLTDGESRHGSWIFSHDGQQMVYTSNARNGRDMDLYIRSGGADSEARLLLEVEGHWFPIDFSADGEKILVGHYVSINDSRVYLLELSDSSLTRLTPESPLASYRDARFSSSGDAVFLTTDREGEFVELYRRSLNGEEEWEALSRDIPWNIEAIDLSHDGRTLAFTANEDGYSVLYLQDLRRGRRQRVSNVPRGRITNLHFARDRAMLGFSASTPNQNGEAYTYDLRQRRLTRWTRSELGGLDERSFGVPELVHYPTFDGREIPAFYYRPEGEGPFPVVVRIHGGPESQSRPIFSPLTQYLVTESRCAVLVPNVRGSDGYGKSYLLLDNGMQRENSVRDIGALLDWIERRPELDEERVGVFGGSYGGYMVLSSLVHFGERIRAGVDIVGISSFVTFLENTRDYRRDLRRAEYGDERIPEMRTHLTRISPVTRATEIRSALFVAHGANDPRVPVGEAEQIVEAVRRSGQEVWYMLARNEGHGFRKKENRDLFLSLSVLFLEQQLRR